MARKIGKVDLKVTSRSGFDKSHRNLFTMKCGTLYPILTDEILPNSTIHLKQAMSAQLPPLATDAFANVKIKTEAFFVPYRLLYGGYENWITETPTRDAAGNSLTTYQPILELDPATVTDPLCDYLGVKLPTDWDSSASETGKVNIFPFLAYHKIYDDWYRNSKIQAPVFIPNHYGLTTSVQNLPYSTIVSAANQVFDGTRTTAASAAKNGFLADGKYITDLRQRNFGLDYFVGSETSAQRGGARTVVAPVSGGNASFTIAALRAQNSLQQFAERNNYSYRIEDYNLVNYGARLHRGMATRPIFLGQQVIDILSKGVYQTSPYDDNNDVTTNNPFGNSVGAKFGNAYCVGEDTLIENFTADEAGIIMVMCSIVPKVTYGTGTRRYMNHYTASTGSQVDLANATLQNVGQQPIYVTELTGGLFSASPAVFSYTDRYAEYMTMEDEVHGLLKDGKSLESFALQRGFLKLSAPSMNSSFLEIPQTYLDQILSVTTGVSGVSAWAEAYFDYKVVQPLAEYSIPSLQDPAYEHGHDVTVNRNGAKL